MPFPLFLVLILICAFLFQHHLRKNMRIEDKHREIFWAKEAKSLSVRRKPLTPEDYIYADISQLTFPPLTTLSSGEQRHYQRLIREIKEFATLDLMNFSTLTNTEIRIRFGTAHQTLITQNEENYVQLLRRLAEYGHFMINAHNPHEAIIAFEETVRLGSDYSDHYLSLATLYQEQHQKDKLEQLKNHVKASPSPAMASISKKLTAF